MDLAVPEEMARVKRTGAGASSSAQPTDTEDVESLRQRCQTLKKELDQYKSAAAPAGTAQEAESKGTNLPIDIPFCYILILAAFIGFSVSLVLALWYSIIHEDVSGGFTIGSYVIAAAGFLVAIPGYRHSFSCRCWGKANPESADG